MAGTVMNFTPRPQCEPDELIGVSQGLQDVRDAVQIVSKTDSTVLIQGETGTGKELVAKAIHMCSARSRGPYVKLNCAAMPAGLLESELFGHERGAFTGAVSQFAGRFQLADTGTLFLDEIGDMPLELQPKLLRVLQDQEFEHLGGARTIRVDVRVIAATNQNLLQMVKERRFRADLYYRLHVFPIAIPPLRDRPEDIPALVQHFVEKYASRAQKVFSPMSQNATKLLAGYEWPGNVRELENLIQRAVISSPGNELLLPSDYRRSHDMEAPSKIRTLAEVEREHILTVLRRVGGVIGGQNGAASLLGVARTTLVYRMQKLGIGHRVMTPLQATAEPDLHGRKVSLSESRQNLTCD
jgi:formate hydrogenlyase transcriptional activator